MESWQLVSNNQWEMVIRLVIAAFLGAVIGYERARATVSYTHLTLPTKRIV